MRPLHHPNAVKHTMKASGSSSRFIHIALVLLPAIWLLSYYLRIQNPLFRSYATQQHKAWSRNQDEFVEEWLNATGGVRPDRSSIHVLCNQTQIKWRPNLVLRLDDANGGLCNVRNNILDFVNFAISAGASIMVPTFATRSHTDLSQLWAGHSPFEGFFDKAYFLATLQSRCPQMVIHDSEKDHTLPSPLPDVFSPNDSFMRSDLIPGQTATWAVEAFNTWMDGRDSSSDDEEIDTTVVNFKRTLYMMDTRSLPPNVRRDLSGLLRPKPEARRLAGIVIHNLARRFQLDIDPSRPYYPNAFFGAHLRTDADAKNAGWMNGDAYTDYDGQTSVYLKQAKEHGLGVIYCASGNPDDLHKFTVEAWIKHGINVTHKADLLTDTDLFALRRMTWDQQALVDYEVMARSSYFAGIVRSSFSFNVALRRNVFAEEEGRNQEKHWYKPEDMDVNRTFEDGLSTVWGYDENHSRKCPRGIWP